MACEPPPAKTRRRRPLQQKPGVRRVFVGPTMHAQHKTTASQSGNASARRRSFLTPRDLWVSWSSSLVAARRVSAERAHPGQRARWVSRHDLRAAGNQGRTAL